MKKQEVSEKNGRICIRLIVARSNPVIWRELCISDHAGIREFKDAACIALGIAPTDAILSEVGEEAQGEEPLDACFGDTDRRVFQLLPPDAGKNEEGLTIYADKLSGDAKDGDIPEVTGAKGINLPPEVWDAHGLNFIHQGIVRGTTVLYNENIYDEQAVSFLENKTLNAMRRCFAPELAEKEVNRRICMPMKQLLGNLKMDALRYIVDTYGVYTYSGRRKAELIGDICHKFERSYIVRLVQEMTIDEVLAFREFALDEQPVRTDPEIEDTLALFWDRGLISEVSGRGYCVASELMDYYEELYESGREKEFLRDKYLETAMQACSCLYGIFDAEMFEAVLKVLNPPEIEEAVWRGYYIRIHDGYGMLPVSALDEKWCYHGRESYKKIVMKIFKRIAEGAAFYLPTREEACRIAEEGIGVSDKNGEAFGKITDKYRRRYYSYYESGSSGRDDTMDTVVAGLHWGDTVEEAFTKLNGQLPKLNWESETSAAEIRAELKKLLESESQLVPLVELRGYTLKNCPKEMKQHYEKQKEAEVQKAAEKKSPAAAERKTAVKRAVAAKKKK